MRSIRLLREHALVLVIYALVAMGASWPLLRELASRPIGDVAYDQQHALWMLWHVKEAVLLRQPLFTGDLLFYPHGISTLVDGVGPLPGIFALPFWPWGPVAAYNGALLMGLTLTGWCMYLLVRYARPAAGVAWSLPHGGHHLIALCAGFLYMLWPIHLAGMYGHLEKVFIGVMPLAVLAAYLAWDPARSRAWWIAPGVTLLVALLQNGNQFLFAALAVGLLAVIVVVWAPPALRDQVVVRVLGSGAIAAVVVAPLLWTIVRVAHDPKMAIVANVGSTYYTPDALQFVLPSIHQAALGRPLYPKYDTLGPEYTRESAIAALNPKGSFLGSGIETAVTIPYTVLGLTILAAASRRAGTRIWLGISGVFVLLALGPQLRLAGSTTFTAFNLPIILPYAFLGSVPGFNIIRTPGRFMMIAGVALILLAATGLAALMDRVPRRAPLVAIFVTVLALVECWPNPWPQQVPPLVPEFYKQLASDPGRYGVLDLPASSPAAYMYYQVFHRKGIAWGYLSRSFFVHPVPALREIESGRFAPDSGPRLRVALAQAGYRYVVWHKHSEMFGLRRPDVASQPPPPGTDARTDRFIREAFAGETPVVDDALVTVYRLDGPSGP